MTNSVLNNSRCFRDKLLQTTSLIAFFSFSIRTFEHRSVIELPYLVTYFI